MRNCISVMSGARLAWHSATASRRQINCKSKGGVPKICFQLAHLAALPQHQDAQTVQFRQGKACRIGVVQDVSAMPVVVAVRNTTPTSWSLAAHSSFLSALSLPGAAACLNSAQAVAATRSAWAVSTANLCMSAFTVAVRRSVSVARDPASRRVRLGAMLLEPLAFLRFRANQTRRGAH